MSQVLICIKLHLKHSFLSIAVWHYEYKFNNLTLLLICSSYYSPVTFRTVLYLHSTCIYFCIQLCILWLITFFMSMSSWIFYVCKYHYLGTIFQTENILFINFVAETLCVVFELECS